MPTVNHPSRNRNAASATPSAVHIQKAREAADLTPAQAGALIYERASRWRAFETGDARMHPAAWELWNIKRREQADASPGLCDVQALGTIGDLARSVYYSDASPTNGDGADLSQEAILETLDVALRSRIGIACLGGRVVALDLGNGHSLVCHTKANE